MKYSFVAAALVASALATDFIKVEVADSVEVENRGNHHRGGMRHGHRGRRYEDDEEQQGFWSSLWNRGRHGGNSRHRHHRGRGYEADDMFDMFGGNERREYECTLVIPDKNKHEQVMRECCKEAYGHLSRDDQACDVGNRPETDEFEQCAIHRGAQNAQCRRIGRNDYMEEEMNRREQYECTLVTPDPNQHGRVLRECCREADGHVTHNDQACDVGDRHETDEFEQCASHMGAQNAQCRRIGRNDYMEEEMNRREQYECTLVIRDPNQHGRVLRECCREADGHVTHNDKACDVGDRRETDEFEQCAIHRGAQNARCHRIRQN